MINGLDNMVIDKYIKLALEEDVTSEDITTNSVIGKEIKGTCDLICREDGIIAGMPVFKRVFEILGGVEVKEHYKDGYIIKKGDIVATLQGNIRHILIGERTALNYLQRMSGIATLTAEMVKELDGSNTKLLDTRKTTPNMRIFEKYSVKVGGGYNHRYNLSDGILIKDNHIGAAGGIKEAIELAKEYAPFVRKIEVEVESLEGVKEALGAKADIIMLDNMDNVMLKKAVKLIGKKAITECSGNVTIERLKELKEIGVNYISSGALTHSAKILDFSMKNLKRI
ncbi:carboxylating nicotinate-nucleotide diphosphorylase [uncultured Clostridium sp.]|jgi:nicotinate-nucleotide pyrophosphorylase (carboxylating)|uniref:carboxylating nicotinate-nucleotide diphosphorylase n=1 Tax=uncultured Clostridium sp. TaxID=59620 RepID=UPI0026295410|nr:carboxylating nicotinate-nucleotide diphosphorylase [uncultured Clostridium sp.]